MAAYWKAVVEAAVAAEGGVVVAVVLEVMAAVAAMAALKYPEAPASSETAPFAVRSPDGSFDVLINLTKRTAARARGN